MQDQDEKWNLDVPTTGQEIPSDTNSFEESDFGFQFGRDSGSK